jgi:bacterioferritin (cytochrome b1)
VIAHCETARDDASRELCESILAGEEEHSDFLEAQFETIEWMGPRNCVQLQSKPAEG